MENNPFSCFEFLNHVTADDLQSDYDKYKKNILGDLDNGPIKGELSLADMYAGCTVQGSSRRYTITNTAALKRAIADYNRRLSEDISSPKDYIEVPLWNASRSMRINNWLDMMKRIACSGETVYIRVTYKESIQSKSFFGLMLNIIKNEIINFLCRFSVVNRLRDKWRRSKTMKRPGLTLESRRA